MAKNIREVFGQDKAPAQQIGALEAVKEGFQAVAPGLSLRKIFGDIKNELTEQLKHGSHELSAALFNGSPFVMYARGGRDNEQQNEQQQGSPEVQQQEQERGGREI